MSGGNTGVDIHVAAYQGDALRLEEAVLCNLEFETFDKSGRTPLHYATSQNHIDCCALLLDQRSDLIDVGDQQDNDTPLHIASACGYTELLRLLLGYAANADARNRKGYTPAHAVANVDCLKILHEFEADLCARDKHGRCPLFCAAAADRVDCVTWLCCHQEGPSMIAFPDSSGDTALHAAACNGSVGSLKEMGGLITYKVLMSQNLQGFTAPDLARLNHHTDCLEYLRTLEKSFIDMNSQNYNLGGTTNMPEQPVWQPPYANRPGTAMPSNERFDRNSGMWGAAEFPYADDYGFVGQDPWGNGGFQDRPRTANWATFNGDRAQTGIGGAWLGMDPQLYESLDPLQGEEIFAMPQEEDMSRPKTPWTIRREQGRMEDWCGEWAKFVDRETGKPFWWNSITGESTWEMPEAAKALTESQEPVSEAQQIRQRSYVVDVIGDWTECQDPVTGDTFFYNKNTCECEWELPPDIEEQRVIKQQQKEEEIRRQAEKEAEEMVLAMKQTNEQRILQGDKQVAKTMNTKWKTSVDPETGSIFYVHTETGETQWNKPEEMEEGEPIVSTEEAKAEALDIEEMKEKIKAEAAKELAAQVKEVISSSEEERSELIRKMRSEFESQLQATAKQTEALAAQIKAESEAARQKREKEALEVQKLRNKEEQKKEVQQMSNEKKEILTEHSEELKQLTAVLSADRARQNEKLQEKLQERRKARALKRAAAMNQVKAKSPKGGNGKAELPAISPSSAVKANALVQLEGSASNLFATIEPTAECLQALNQALTENPQLKLLLSLHNQYLPRRYSKHINNSKNGSFFSLLWVLFRAHIPVHFVLSPKTKNKLDRKSLAKLLEHVKLCKSSSSGEPVVPLDVAMKLMKTDTVDYIEFIGFIKELVETHNIDLVVLVETHALPVLADLGKRAIRRGVSHQKNSKALATEQVRNILQENLSQLKLIYMHYVALSNKAKRSSDQRPSNTITLPYTFQMAKDYTLLPSVCSVRALFGLYEDMHIRKPGAPGCLENLSLPFNQWVQYLFHISVRFDCTGEKRSQEQGLPAHERVNALLRRMDASLAKNKIKAKGVKAFYLYKPDGDKEAE